MEWNYVDVLFILLSLFYIWQGWQRGLILGMLELVSWAGGFVVALRIYEPAGHLLELVVAWPQVWLLPIAFVLVAILSGLFIHLIGSLLLRFVPANVHQHPLNQFLGLVPGAINGLIAITIIASLMLALPLPVGLNAAVRASKLASQITPSADPFEMVLSPVFAGAVKQTLNLLTVHPHSDERVDLPFVVNAPTPRPDLESEMLDLINHERAAAGLPALQSDPVLTQVARQHSADMFARSYFSHVTPTGLDPFDRMGAAGIQFSIAGENIALAPDLSIAHTGLMNSPDHRDNILRPEFGRIGIGIMDGGPHGIMITQDFRD